MDDDETSKCKTLAWYEEERERRTKRMKKIGHGWMTIVVERFPDRMEWMEWGKKEETEEKGSYGR